MRRFPHIRVMPTAAAVRGKLGMNGGAVMFRAEAYTAALPAQAACAHAAPLLARPPLLTFSSRLCYRLGVGEGVAEGPDPSVGTSPSLSSRYTTPS